MNSIPGASMVDYVSVRERSVDSLGQIITLTFVVVHWQQLFKDTLVYLMGEANQRKAVADADKAKIRRNLIEHVVGELTLELLVKFEPLNRRGLRSTYSS